MKSSPLTLIDQNFYTTLLPMSQKRLHLLVLVVDYFPCTNSEGEVVYSAKSHSRCGRISANLKFERPVGLVHRNHSTNHSLFTAASALVAFYDKCNGSFVYIRNSVDPYLCYST